MRANEVLILRTTVKRVPGFTGYAVSPCGKMFSQRKCGATPFDPAHPWKQLTDYRFADKNGDHRVQYSLRDDAGKFRKLFRAVVILTAWVGPRPEGFFACHNDGDTLNDSLSNIRWDTPKGNEADKLIHGTHQRGERHARSKLVATQVIEIRQSTEHYTVLAQRYGVSDTTIFDIRKRRSWRHLV